MVKILKIKHTYDINISGEPSLEIKTLPAPTIVGVSPASISGIKPKLLLKEGSVVKKGEVLFTNKSDLKIKFLSPGAGKISKIIYGPRRKIEAVEITLDSKEESVELPKLSLGEISKKSQDELAQILIDAGVWGRFKQNPFRQIPRTNERPSQIYVSFDNDEAFLPQSEIYLKGKEKELEFGLALLKVFSTEVFVATSKKNIELQNKLGSNLTHVLDGAYPSNDPGVFHYYNKKSSSENKAWLLKGQDLIYIAETLMSGQFVDKSVLVIAGPQVLDPTHYVSRVGASVGETVKNLTKITNVRFIAGGVLTGRKVSDSDFLNHTENAINVIEDNKAPDLFYFMGPGLKKTTKSATYVSALNPGFKGEMSTSLNGGIRSCIACGECPKVCPVEIQPQFLYKDIIVGDVEESLAKGLLDCVECGLCDYVCPSKIDLSDAFSEKRAAIAKEVFG